MLIYWIENLVNWFGRMLEREIEKKHKKRDRKKLGIWLGKKLEREIDKRKKRERKIKMTLISIQLHKYRKMCNLYEREKGCK